MTRRKIWTLERALRALERWHDFNCRIGAQANLKWLECENCQNM